jgi:hypothetical protein
MRSNDVADIIGAYLSSKHTRVYRAKSPALKAFPYIVYRVESGVDSYPSEDLTVNIDFYESPEDSIRSIEELADTIDDELNHSVIIQNGINLHFERENRQSIDNQDIIEAYLINLRYTVRAYFV